MEENLAVEESWRGSTPAVCFMGDFKGFLKISLTIGKITL